MCNFYSFCFKSNRCYPNATYCLLRIVHSIKPPYTYYYYYIQNALHATFLLFPRPAREATLASVSQGGARCCTDWASSSTSLPPGGDNNTANNSSLGFSSSSWSVPPDPTAAVTNEGEEEEERTLSLTHTHKMHDYSLCLGQQASSPLALPLCFPPPTPTPTPTGGKNLRARGWANGQSACEPPLSDRSPYPQFDAQQEGGAGATHTSCCRTTLLPLRCTILRTQQLLTAQCLVTYENSSAPLLLLLPAAALFFEFVFDARASVRAVVVIVVVVVVGGDGVGVNWSIR